MPLSVAVTLSVPTDNYRFPFYQYDLRKQRKLVCVAVADGAAMLLVVLGSATVAAVTILRAGVKNQPPH